jgi:molecular chaperone HtpG
MAEEILSSIGSSNKHNRTLRGFRGIGRLGGIAFSEKAIFKTKVSGENIESIQVWDCNALRNLINSKNNSLTFKELFDLITHFSQKNGQPIRSSYFEVTLEGVSSFRNHVFDIERIRSYLSQVVPLPFNHDNFSFGQEIDSYLKEYLSHYRAYDIFLNGEKMFKPYQNIIKTSIKKGNDFMDGIEYFKLKLGNRDILAYGWYGKRRNLLGAIKRGEEYSGIRVRIGNIVLGDAHLLDRCFREDRFNGYMVGEIHIDSPGLIPNSRRDDFIDSETKTMFYNAFEKEIGLPISKEIRYHSRIRSQSVSSLDNKYSEPELEEYKQSNDSSLISNDQSSHNSSITGLNKIKALCRGCPKLPRILSGISGVF